MHNYFKSDAPKDNKNVLSAKPHGNLILVIIGTLQCLSESPSWDTTQRTRDSQEEEEPDSYSRRKGFTMDLTQMGM